MTVLLLAGGAVGQAAQYYVLDGFGGVHAGGGAGIISPATPYFGFDVARGLAYVPYGVGGANGDGVLVLDGFGGIHAGGTLPSASANPHTPYFGFDAARAIAYRNVPPRAGGLTNSQIVNLSTTSTAFTSVGSVVINAPDDGFVLVNASTSVFCGSGAAGTATVEVRVDIDSTVGQDGSRQWATFPDCTALSPGVTVPIESIAITQAFSVSAGSHTVHLLARKAGGTLSVAVDSRSLTVIFIDQNTVGSS